VLAYQHDPRYLRLYPCDDRTVDEVLDSVQVFLEWWADQQRCKFRLMITLSDSGRLVGKCELRRKAEYGWEADIGYGLSPEHWGPGYGAEDAQAMIVFGSQGGWHCITSWQGV
jgi:ribosomal-protein-alanine N-acetyltransferase